MKLTFFTFIYKYIKFCKKLKIEGTFNVIVILNNTFKP
jgi:hypothetical protein